MQRAAAAERFRLIQQLQDRLQVLWLVKKLQAVTVRKDDVSAAAPPVSTGANATP